MTQPAITIKDVRRAEAGVISTPILQELSRQAHAAKNETISEEGAVLLLLCFAPIVDELLEYRRRRDAALDLTSQVDMSNVVRLQSDN